MSTPKRIIKRRLKKENDNSNLSELSTTKISLKIDSKLFTSGNKIRIRKYKLLGIDKHEHMSISFMHRSKDYIHDFYGTVIKPDKKFKKPKRTSSMERILNLKILEKEKTIQVKTEHDELNRKIGKYVKFTKTWKIIFDSQKQFERVKKLIIPFFKEQDKILVPLLQY